jgi:nitronate monooxygenase
MLNLLLESERAGVAVLARLAGEVEQAELRTLLLDAREQELGNAATLERLIRQGGGEPTPAIGPFVGKVAALASLRDRLNLLMRGQEWVARKIEETLTLAPDSGAVHDALQRMANRHRHEVEWGRAELIRLMDTIK